MEPISPKLVLLKLLELEIALTPLPPKLGGVKRRVIEDVKHLRPELHGEALADRDIFERGEVELG